MQDIDYLRQAYEIVTNIRNSDDPFGEIVSVGAALRTFAEQEQQAYERGRGDAKEEAAVYAEIGDQLVNRVNAQVEGAPAVGVVGAAYTDLMRACGESWYNGGSGSPLFEYARSFLRSDIGAIEFMIGWCAQDHSAPAESLASDECQCALCVEDRVRDEEVESLQRAYHNLYG